MDPLSAASGIAGLIAISIKAIQLVSEYISLAHEHKQLAETVHKELLLMKQVLDQLKDLINEEKRKGGLTGANDQDRSTVLGKAISDCTRTIEQIGDKLIEPVNKFKKAMARLKWPFDQKEVLRMVDSLRRYTQLFQLSLTVSNCELLSRTFDVASEGLKLQRDKSKEIQKLCAGFPHMARDAEEILRQTETLLDLVPTLKGVSLEIKEIGHAQMLAEQREQERRTTDILDWLCPLSTLQKHSDIKARRADGTGGWFLKKAELCAWMSAESGHLELLCLGDPGVGKTNLASLVVDTLIDIYKDSDVAVVHLYCDYREQQAQSPQVCARSILRQLSMQINGNTVPSSVSELYQRTRNEVKDQSWYMELQKILCRVASTFSRVFLVVDALDEAEPSSHMPGLLALLHVLRTGLTTSNPKIFATSRKFANSVQEFFLGATQVLVTASNGDLRTILTKIIADHQDSRYVLDETLKEEIVEKLCASAHGMFLLPILQIQDILSQLTRSEVRRSLRELSPNLVEVFQSTIGRILNLPSDQRHAMNRRNLAVKALMWISHAKRVLTVVELQHALAVRLEDLELDTENFIDPQLIVDSCFGLVEIDRESSTIRFVHYSLQEHLKSHDHGLFKDGDVEVTRICLRYMSLNSVKDLHAKNLQSFIQALKRLPFLNYATAEWGHHASKVSPEDVKDLALGFLNSSPHLLSAARARDYQSPYFRKWHERMYAWAYSDGAGISLCAGFGLIEFVRLLVGQYKQPNLKARNMYGSTPLHEAAMRGYESTAQLLLEYGADVLDLNLGKSTPLYLAAANDQIGMVRLLLQGQAGPQLNMAGKEGWTVLHQSADAGSEEMVALLLQHGAMANAVDEKGLRPLHLAARKGRVEVVRLLILSMAEVPAKALDRLTPLDYAVTGGHLEVSKMLLDSGAHIEHRSQDRWTALQRASRGGHPDIVALLLRRGADVLTEDHRGEIPLHAAARSGNNQVVELLLNERSNVKKEQLCKKERKGSTPRDVAFFTAHFDIYKLLRAAEMGAEEPRQTTGGKISAAIELGKKDKVRRLLADKSFEVDSLLDGRQPALHLAMQEGQVEIVKVLLEYGASINSVGFHGWNPLHVAAAIGNVVLTELCLSNGADVRALTGTAQTPLHKACSSKNSRVVKALLEAGADKEAVNQRGMRPLHIAAHQNNLDMVRLLIEDYHVDIAAGDTSGATAADWAERSGHLDVLQCLKREEKKRKKARGLNPFLAGVQS